jgi:hypothetical protein
MVTEHSTSWKCNFQPSLNHHHHLLLLLLLKHYSPLRTLASNTMLVHSPVSDHGLLVLFPLHVNPLSLQPCLYIILLIFPGWSMIRISIFFFLNLCLSCQPKHLSNYKVDLLLSQSTYFYGTGMSTHCQIPNLEDRGVFFWNLSSPETLPVATLQPAYLFDH